MSYKVALWAIAGREPIESTLQSLRYGISDVAIDVDMGDAYIVAKAIDGVTFVHLLATGREPGSGINRGAIHESLPTHVDMIAFLGYDDQNGVKVFDHWGGGHWLFLLTDGASLGGTLPAITVDYSPEDDDAISIGLRQLFGWTKGNAFLDLVYEKQGIHARTGDLVDIPPDAVPLVAFWPGDRDWNRADLEPRDY